MVGALLLFALISCWQLADGALSVSERDALVDAFHSLNGRKWRNGTGPSGRWLQGDPCEQRWYGVTCDANNTHVIEFFPSQTQSGNALSGVLPASLGNLSRLQHLVLSNAFTHTGVVKGTIPDSFASLSELQCVYFSHNRLSGTIPAATSRMRALQGFFMRDNRLSGSLPDVRGWRDLRSVDLDSNEIAGDLSSFAQLPKVAVIIMHNMLLEGRLPPELCHVFQCDARDNAWRCPLPPHRNASKGSRCCLVDKCTNASAAVSTSSSSVISSKAITTAEVADDRRRLQADPGDLRPYGPGCEC
eukprot:SAG11_NODE_40_length_21525_cov_16.276066_12_plen_302_part_00